MHNIFKYKHGIVSLISNPKIFSIPIQQYIVPMNRTIPSIIHIHFTCNHGFKCNNHLSDTGKLSKFMEVPNK